MKSAAVETTSPQMQAEFSDVFAPLPGNTSIAHQDSTMLDESVPMPEET